jgi:hypothetical protein
MIRCFAPHATLYPSAERKSPPVLDVGQAATATVETPTHLARHQRVAMHLAAIGAALATL